jgi:excisionase family DNA binding protein
VTDPAREPALAPDACLADGVNGLDLAPVLARLLGPGGQHPGMPHEQATVDVAMYRCFLALARLCPREPLVPSPRIDRAWHAHMLDTRADLADCRQALGGILHHQAMPDGGRSAAGGGSEHTCRLAAGRLGIDLAAAEFHAPGVDPVGHGWRADRWDHPSAVLTMDGLLADEPLLTVAEVADLTRLSKGTIYRLADTGDLDSIKIGSSIRVPERAARGLLNRPRRRG